MSWNDFGTEHECAACRAKPGAPNLCELCLRRRALSPGERIADPALLCKGMRVRDAVYDSETVLSERLPYGETFKWSLGDGCHIYEDDMSGGPTFLGWATEEAGEVREKAIHMRTAFGNWARLCDGGSGGQVVMDAGQVTCETCVRTMGFIPAKPPEPAPAKRCSWVSDDGWLCALDDDGHELHVSPAVHGEPPAPAKAVAVHDFSDPYCVMVHGIARTPLCKRCGAMSEGQVVECKPWNWRAQEDKEVGHRTLYGDGLVEVRRPTTREFYEPLRSGLGGMVGGIWRVR